MRRFAHMESGFNQEPQFTRWEADEFVILAFGGPVGKTMTEKDAKLVCEWLSTAKSEIEQRVAKAFTERIK